MPGEGEDIPSHSLQNFRIDRIGRIGGLMKVWVDAAADDGDGWDTRLFEWDVIATGKESEEIELLRKTDCLSRFERHVFLKSRHTNRQPSIADSRMVDVDHGFR